MSLGMAEHTIKTATSKNVDNFDVWNQRSGFKAVFRPLDASRWFIFHENESLEVFFASQNNYVCSFNTLNLF